MSACCNAYAGQANGKVFKVSNESIYAFKIRFMTAYAPL
jgi:hypothetical protein